MTTITNNGQRTTDAGRLWLLAALGVVLLWAIPSLRYPLGRDQATYCVIGEGLLNGQQLYRDLWDNKPPGIFYVYAGIVKLFGSVMWSVGVVDILWLLVISFCIFRFTRRYLGVPAAALSVVFYAIKHTRQGYVHAAQPETFMVLCIFLAYFLLLPDGRWPRLWAGASGVMLGAAFWLKYNAIVFFPFVMLLPFLDLNGLDHPSVDGLRLSVSRRDWWGRAALLGGGFIGSVAGVLGYFWLVGAWPALKEVQLEVLPRYGAKVFQWNLPYVVWALTRTHNHVGLWTEVMAALTLLVGWRRRELALVAPVLLMALAGFVAAAMQGRFHPYYFETCYPFLAMCWGYICVKAYQAFRFGLALFMRRGWRLARLLLWVAFANLVFALLPEEAVRLVQHYEFLADWWRNPEQSYAEYWWQIPLEKLPDQLHVIDYLKENSRPGDQVYVWGTAPLVNFLTGRRSPSRFVSNLALISSWGPDQWRQELVWDLERSHPRFIVVARHDSFPSVSYTWRDSEEYLQVYPALAGLLRNEYRPAQNFPDFEIYRRKDE